jgi:hypothetical protein
MCVDCQDQFCGNLHGFYMVQLHACTARCCCPPRRRAQDGVNITSRFSAATRSLFKAVQDHPVASVCFARFVTACPPGSFGWVVHATRVHQMLSEQLSARLLAGTGPAKVKFAYTSTPGKGYGAFGSACVRRGRRMGLTHAWAHAHT